MADISKITLPTGNTYDIKDATAREAIKSLSGYTKFLGVTTTALVDGSTTATIIIEGVSVTATTGAIATYGSKEFIWNGTAWQEFGDMSSIGALGRKDSASGSYTPKGTVSKPTFTGTEGDVSVSGTPSGTISTKFELKDGEYYDNYTPEGTVSKPTFTGTATTSTGKFTPSGTITTECHYEDSTGEENQFTPRGSVSQPTFTGTSGSVSVSGTPKGSVSVSPTTDTVYSITSVGTAPSWSASVSNETLSFSFSAGSVPSRTSKTVMTGASASFTGTATTSTGSFTPSGTVSEPEFTGEMIQLYSEFRGTSGSVLVTGTPSGDVSQPTFTGNKAFVKSTFTGTATTSTGKFTPSGAVSQPTFTGTTDTITVS